MDIVVDEVNGILRLWRSGQHKTESSDYAQRPEGKGNGFNAATYTCDTQVLDGGDAMSCSRGEEIAINSALCLLALAFGDMANWDRSTSVVSALFKRTSEIKLTLLEGVEP